MPDEALESEQDRIAADAEFVQRSSLSTSRSRASAKPRWEPTSTTRSAREMVLFELVQGPLAPRDVGESAALGTGQAHRALNDLRDRDLAELLLPAEAADGPVFSLTTAGEKVTYHIEQDDE